MSHRSQASERSAAGLCTMTKQPSASRMMLKRKWNDPNKNTSNLGLRTPWLGREKLVDRLTSNDALRYLTLPKTRTKILTRYYYGHSIENITFATSFSVSVSTML